MQYCKIKPQIQVIERKETNKQKFLRNALKLKKIVFGKHPIKIIRISDKESDKLLNNLPPKKLTANIVTEISRKKDKETVNVKTNINNRYLMPI